jgi:3-oxoacyl-[acyl-carrier-protein] synthase I
MSRNAFISRVGACTPLGLKSATSYAAFRAGISRVSETATLGLDGEPVRASTLELLNDNLSREERMRELAARAMRELLAPGPPSPRLRRIQAFLGLPAGLSKMTRLVDWPSQVFTQDRSSFFFALDAAMSALDRGECDGALVGAVDSLCTTETLAQQRRLLGPPVSDGLIPGEGAGFLLLTSRAAPGSLGQVIQAAVGCEARHFHHAEPNQGKGLTAVLRAVRTHPAVRGRRADLLFTCETGERFWADELAMAYFRNVALMPEPFVRSPAAEGLGDLGAAAGAVMTALGVHALGPSASLLLVCGSADEGHVGACLLEGKAA